MGVSALAAAAMMGSPAISAENIPADAGNGKAVAEQQGAEQMGPEQQGNGHAARHHHARHGGLPLAEGAPPPAGLHHGKRHGAHHGAHHGVHHRTHYGLRHKGLHRYWIHPSHDSYAIAGQFAVPLGAQGYSAPAYRGHGRVATTVYTAPYEPYVDGGSVVGPRPVGTYERSDGARVIVMQPIVRRVPHRHFHRHW
ncbi:MAG: hypothetical protein HKN60_05865 [Rhizobiales bacterium]|nr:hypothetical protein [Hyphomicrobiales bacterium]